MPHSFGPLEAVILDFGGVLFDIDYPAPARALKELGLKNFEDLYSKASQADLFDLLETGHLSNEAFLTQVQRLMPETIGLDAIRTAWNSILTGLPAHRMDAVKLLLPHYRTFLLSNTNAIHVEAFEPMIDRAVGLENFRACFEAIHYSNVLGIRKPHPETFLHVCALHKLTPATTLFVDDSPQHVEGAKAAGLQAYHLEIDKEEIGSLIAELVPR